MLPRAAASTFLGAAAASAGAPELTLGLLLALLCSCLPAGAASPVVDLFCSRGLACATSTKPACSFSSFLSPRPGTLSFSSAQLAKGPCAVRSSATR